MEKYYIGIDVIPHVTKCMYDVVNYVSDKSTQQQQQGRTSTCPELKTGDFKPFVVRVVKQTQTDSGLNTASSSIPMSSNLICGLFLLVALICNYKNVEATKLRPIHIGLSIDDHSLKDLVILINSVVESALEPSELVFHIVACGKDLMSAMVLKKIIVSSMDACLPDVKREVVAFMLPSESGFALQLGHLKKKSNHWNSQSGADMVRFFMPSLFSHVERILYLDNDIIVSCCLEEVYDTPFEDHQIIGIALDSLNWATVTQFQRHYNASHPLVVKNMRRLPLDKQHQKSINDSYNKKTKSETEISTKEFSAMLPRYPNDGVLLIDVKKYNEVTTNISLRCFSSYDLY